MSQVLVVGSVALDTLETPFGRAEDAVGGSAVYFSAAASVFAEVALVGVVGEDYPLDQLDFLEQRDVDLSGLRIRPGRSFRWSGVYDYDLNSRETLDTELGVFADFEADVPREVRDVEWVFLGNIHPDLQTGVLDQLSGPRMVACDTMNYWIENTPELLERLLGRVDLLLVNDAEARELSGDHNLARAARWIRDQGPSHVVIKKGEHGAILFSPQGTFFAPGYPLEEVFDPTGAGDAFAGGMLGHLARTGSTDLEEMKRAVVYGSALGSFVCEAFGVDRLAGVDSQEIYDRVRQFREMTRFEHGLALEG